MALRGSLDDVPIVDVLQFIHMAGKSGVLSLVSDSGRAWVEFSQGNIVFARSPAAKSLGALLVETGSVEPDALVAAIRQQTIDSIRPPLGRLLLDRGAVDRTALAACVRRQIYDSMMDIMSWSSGDFEFDQTTVEVLDETRVDTAEVLPLPDLSTKFLLMEAVRLVDERRRDIQIGLTPVSLDPAPAVADHRQPDAADIAAGIVDIEPTPTLPPVRSAADQAGPVSRVSDRKAGVILVGFEKSLTPVVFDGLTRDGYPVIAHVPLREVERQLLGQRPWPGSMVVIIRVQVGDVERQEDLEAHLQAVGGMLARHPGWSVIALISGWSPEAIGRLYSCGVRAALPLESPPGSPQEVRYDSQAVMLSGLVGVLSRVWRENARAAHAQASELRTWLQAKRITSDMQRALQRASIALELLRVASQTLDRSILFLVKEGELQGLGAFGLAADGKPLAEVVRGITLSVTQETPLARSLAERRVSAGPAQQLGLGDSLFELAGTPANDSGVLVPLFGSAKTIGVLYGDNGAVDAPFGSVHAIEIAAAHAGIAYENQQLRMMLDARRRTP